MVLIVFRVGDFGKAQDGLSWRAQIVPTFVLCSISITVVNYGSYAGKESELKSITGKH